MLLLFQPQASTDPDNTITYLDDDYLDPDRELPDEEAQEMFLGNPEALLDLIYGPTRRIQGAIAPHDHEEDGGEFLLKPIIAHSFGHWQSSRPDKPYAGLGLVLPRPSSTLSYATSSVNGITDRTAAKRLWCAGALIPGGVAGVRVQIVEWHDPAGVACALTVALRGLASVNHKLGAALDEVLVDVTYTTVGASTWSLQTALIEDIGALGDVALDREVEVSLWLSCDLDTSLRLRVVSLEILPIYLAAGARTATARDLAMPAFAARELKADVGVFSAQLAAKIRESYNNLNRALWGYTPGLLNDLTPDRRRRYRETITEPHQHRGLIVPDDGDVYSDGACLRDAQSFGFVHSIGIDFSLAEDGTNIPYAGDHPQGGLFSRISNDNWHFRFRRSIPAGCGALVMRACFSPNFETVDDENANETLFIKITAIPVDGSGDIVSRVFCGPFAQAMESTSVDYGYCELRPEDDPAYLSNSELDSQFRKGWNRTAEVDADTQSALYLLEPDLNERSYAALGRVSKPILVALSYPPLRPSEDEHVTTDYSVSIYLYVRRNSTTLNSAGDLKWLLCYTATGY